MSQAQLLIRTISDKLDEYFCALFQCLQHLKNLHCILAFLTVIVAMHFAKTE